MLKKFIEHIQETTQPIIREIGPAIFAITADGRVNEVRPTIDHPDTLDLHSLDALVKLVQTEAGKASDLLYITIPDHLTVHCFGRPDPNARFFRQTYYEVKATDVPGWEKEMQMGFEEAQIALRTRFQETTDTIYAMKLLSDICCGAKVIYNDNGVATTVTTQKGVALQSNEQVRPIITLKPYRTFQEVEQPESIFLIRVNERGISFTEADGGMWKLKARETIKAFLEGKLSQEISEGSVIIAL
ncbi:MAG: hypothetical protein HFF84_14805 [Oscillibacter sp.]|nr:hypothetical protein [Oscillibacter sp.]